MRTVRTSGPVALLLVIVCALPGLAHAVGPRVVAAQERAASLFPQVTAACPSVTLTEGLLSADPVHHGAEAYPPCEIRLATQWPRWSRSYACILLIHEYGHLAGLEHSPDQGSFMHPQASPLSHSACLGIADLEFWVETARFALDDSQRTITAARGDLRVARSVRHRQRLRRVVRTHSEKVRRLRLRIASVEARLGP